MIVREFPNHLRLGIPSLSASEGRRANCPCHCPSLALRLGHRSLRLGQRPHSYEFGYDSARSVLIGVHLWLFLECGLSRMPEESEHTHSKEHLMNQRVKNTVWVGLIGLLAASVVIAADRAEDKAPPAAPPTVIYKTDKPIAIDGVLDEPAWKQANPVDAIYAYGKAGEKSSEPR